MGTALAISVINLIMAASPPAGDLLTVAERSDWQATATYAEVIELLDSIQERSTVMRRAQLGRTAEGRSIPLVILANPPVASAAEARASVRTVIFAFGNIHAGEVCGKEALLMLTRELAARPDDPLFKDLVIVFAPIYNADGNEKMSLDNRPGQVGPARGMGQRPNAQGLDLNRDYVKLETQEARGLVRFLSEWDPHLTIDTHTTNGSEHRYVLTYAAPLNPSGHPAPIRFVRDEMLPEITRRLRERTGYETFFYGNFDEERTSWQTYSALPRFGGPYRGLRGQMSILCEAYAYASYKDRVLATREFVREILMFAAEHHDRIVAVAEQARRETTEAGLAPQPDDVVGIRHRRAAFDEPVTILGFDTGGEKPPRDYRVVHQGRFEAVRSVRRPWAYVLGPGHDGVVDKLRQHGIEVEPCAGEGRVEIYTVTRIERSPRSFQGHTLLRLEAESRLDQRMFPVGSVLVRTAQPLGTLAVYLLEPESQDGLAAWNFFDDHLVEGGPYPVMRVRWADDLHLTQAR
ncbi:MAG: M14 family metallopeptidase [Planctomycetes bacterium]|nr:M14 family metallopeptidase [Planctomycetota bacterium]